MSRPAALTRAQQGVWRQWSDGLTALDLTLVTIPRANYAASPWEQLRHAVRSADGAVILGFRQAVVEAGTRRPETLEEESAAGSYAGAWNQIEAGLAVMAELPVLVVPEGDAHDGVFSTDVWLDGVYGTRMAVWDAGAGARDASLRDWLTAVRRRATSSSPGHR